MLTKPDVSDILLMVHYITAKWPDLPLSAWNNPFPLDWLLSRNTFQQAVLSLLYLADFTCIQDENFAAFTDYCSDSPAGADDETPRCSPEPSAGTESSAACLLISPNCPNLSPVHQSVDSPLSFPLYISQGLPPTPGPLVGCWPDTPAPVFAPITPRLHTQQTTTTDPTAPKSARLTAPASLACICQPSFRQPKHAIPEQSHSTPSTNMSSASAQEQQDQNQNGDGPGFLNAQMQAMAAMLQTQVDNAVNTMFK